MPAVWISQYSIERYGRRPILLASGVLTAAVLIIMGSCGLITHKSKSVEQVIVVMVYLFLIVFNLGWGPTVWVVTSEISTGKNRGKLMSLSTGSNWFFNWLVSFTFPYLFNADGANLGAKIGFLYGSLTLFAVVWVYFCLPETSGRSLEEIEIMFQKHVPVEEFKGQSTRECQTLPRDVMLMSTCPSIRRSPPFTRYRSRGWQNSKNITNRDYALNSALTRHSGYVRSMLR
jgi:SP family sugar:H+ symporter-like MFS transporter